MTNDCRRIHSERLGRNPVGISGRKIACDVCNSFDHVGTACVLDTVQVACAHCGSFNHGSSHCRELTRAFVKVPSSPNKAARTPIVYSSVQERKIGGELVSSIRDRLNTRLAQAPAVSSEDDWFRLLPSEVGKTPCPCCRSPVHAALTCPLVSSRDFGVNPKNEYGVMQDCEQCGDYSHMVEKCEHSEVNGKNRVGFDGKKLYCAICGSFDHMLECHDKDSERNGRNKVDEASGDKPRCDYCGSYDHLLKACGHTFFAGRHRVIGGRKIRCEFCGSFGHAGEVACGKQNNLVRQFLRLLLGVAKMRVSPTSATWSTSVKKIGKFEDFSHIANSKSLIKDTLTQAEKNEQKSAEQKLKDRLRAKFGVKGAKESPPATPLNEARPGVGLAVFEEEVDEGEDYSYYEPDPSVFDGKELRTNNQYRRITKPMHDSVIDCLRAEKEEVITRYKIEITKRDLYCLTGENWLNDKVLEFYLSMVAARSQESWQHNRQYRDQGLPRVYTMSTYFFLNLIMRGYEGSIQRWNKDVDIFSYHLLLVPIHLEQHWCLAIIDFRNKALLYYDPMGGSNMPALSALLNFLGQEHLHKKGVQLDLLHYAKEIVTDWPQQENTADCGMFVAKAAEFFSRDSEPKFSQADMPYFRKRMIWEILNSQLISP